jgi:ribulose-phosphate 3-epimerase
MVLIAPSILSADFSKLGEEIRRIDKTSADWIHLDIMDGHFVKNLTIGPVVVKSIRKFTKKVFDVHLMVKEPDFWIDKFSKAGADRISFHLEASKKPANTLGFINSVGCKSGIAINPETSLAGIKLLLPKIDLLLLMTVNPGFGGQKFIKGVLPKISKAKEIITSNSYPILLEVDGGIDQQTARWVKEAGADVLVAGSAIFKTRNYGETIDKLRKA